MKKIVTICLFFVFALSAFSQDFVEGRYRITFKDKNNSPYSITNPQAFLSAKAIERREKFNIEITEQDLPVNPQYIAPIAELGAVFCNSSKWFNSAIFYIKNQETFDIIKKLYFIKNMEYVAPKPKWVCDKRKLTEKDSLHFDENDFQMLFAGAGSYHIYGNSWKQCDMLGILQSHFSGHWGQGMTIAIADAGFLHVDSATVFQKIRDDNRLLFTRDVTGTAACLDTTLDIFSKGGHGMQVLSLIGGVYPGKLIGTAPQANFILLRTEEEDTEYTVEEDNWVAAAEIADSAGADIMSTSLGYSDFDDKSQSYTYADMNGNTTRITIGADIAASKGMLILNSAGNSGDEPWKYITAPADADSIITVGACDYKQKKTAFSSFGPTSDKRIKPDVMALGLYPAIVTANGTVRNASGGTSFSCPLMAGACATLWSEFPDSSAQTIKKYILQFADRSNKPNNKYGYGLPNIDKIRNYFYAKQLYNFLSAHYTVSSFDKFFEKLYKNKVYTTYDFLIDIDAKNNGKVNYIIKDHDYNFQLVDLTSKGTVYITSRGMKKIKFKISNKK
ncbi:MAG: S8 family serine peptidase [Bacteroidales bacterium]|nr:S8 family serine peptidase [Bacteroidales bacterium]